MLRPCQDPLLACSVLPTAGVPLIEGAAVFVGGDWPGGVLETADVTERVTRASSVTKLAATTGRRGMPSHRAAPHITKPSKGYSHFVRISASDCGGIPETV